MLRARRLWERGVATAEAVPVLRQDAAFYALSGLFAVGVVLVAVTADYREWAEVSIAPYLGAAAICEVGHRWAARRREAAHADPAEAVHTLRRVVAVALLALVVVLPLAQQVHWRASAPIGRTNLHSAQAQPEVAVIERAGDRFWKFQDPYLSHPTTVGVSPSNDNRSVDDTSYFPYLPGMLPFGFANAVNGPRALTDARIELAGFTLLVVALALYLAPVARRKRVRALQFLVILPTGALPMVTGGDDLPVLALLLLGLVLLARRHPVVGGVVMGIAGTLKWTAWPLLLLAAFAARDDEDRPALIRYGLSVLLIVVPVVGAGVALDPHAFVVNAISFPLGLTKVHSPAASPLLGQVLVQIFPAEKHALTAALVGGALLVVLVALARHVPRTPSQAASFAGWALAFATVVAPATRFGYFIYPANMLVWAYLLSESPATASSPAEDPAVPQLASST